MGSDGPVRSQGEGKRSDDVGAFLRAREWGRRFCWLARFRSRRSPVASVTGWTSAAGDQQVGGAHPRPGHPIRHRIALVGVAQGDPGDAPAGTVESQMDGFVGRARTIARHDPRRIRHIKCGVSRSPLRVFTLSVR